MIFLSNARPFFPFANCPARNSANRVADSRSAGRLEREVIEAVSAFLLAGGAALVISVLTRVTAFS